MANTENLLNRVREALAHLPNLEEKKMFRGITFMLNDKMCVSFGGDEILCRIDPAILETALEKNGAREMIHNGKVMKGFVYVHETALQRKEEFDYWINAAIGFNEKAKATKKKKAV